MNIAEGGVEAASLSKRRGSDSLSINIGTSSSTQEQVLPRARPNLGALASMNAASIAGKDLSTAGNDNALGLKGQIKNPSSATVVDDDDASDPESETGYEGEHEQDNARRRRAANASQASSASSTSTASTASTTTAGNDQQQQAQQQGHQSTSAHANPNAPPPAGAAAYQQFLRNNGHGHGHHRPPAHERGKVSNAHDEELNGQQPMRPRNHHHRASTTSSVGSSKRETENLKPFPTPGMKTEERNPFDEVKSVEEIRLAEAEKKTKHWKRWGPYLSERQWVSGLWTIPIQFGHRRT